MARGSVVWAVLALGLSLHVQASQTSSGSAFEVSIPRSVSSKPLTGRLLLMISKKKEPDLRQQLGPFLPVFGTDVTALRPGSVAVIDGSTPGHIFPRLDAVPAGDYYVQALLNVYSEFRRADGRVIWAHMDQWEGQRLNVSPGNLFSKTQLVHLDASQNYRVHLDLTEIIPEVTVPPDTQWVKHVKIQSRLLSAFWGRPIYLGAVVLLPKGYESRTESRYPVVYLQGHFSHDAPFGFQPEPPADTAAKDTGTTSPRIPESGHEFYKSWSSDGFPRMIAVTFLHPTPFYDDSYAVNSANNGPYGDALLTELIPYLEKQFRIIREPYARALAGGSTGGWEALALQVFNPDFFGGTWSFYPDPVDFRRYGLVNIYEDASAFSYEISQFKDSGVPHELTTASRYFARTAEGQPVITLEQWSRYEAVLGTRGRSGQQLDAWEAAYAPVGKDGYPMPLWDRATGKIDRTVASYMRDRGYDLRAYLEANWAEIGPRLVGKLHFYCGDMDSLYLNLGVYLLEEFLTKAKPAYEGSFEYGRPLKPHGWQPMTNADLMRTIATRMRERAPAEARLSWNDN